MAYTTIDDPEAYFQVKTYTGDGATTQAITLDGDTDMQPDLVWIKSKGAAQAHILVDAVRGANKYLNSNNNGAEGTDVDTVEVFGSDGFTVGDDASVNQSSTALVAWCWKESATAGFDIVLYTGNGTDDTDISHSLSAVPKMILVKRRDGTDSWLVQHGALGATKALNLEGNGAVQTYTPYWSDETPTSSVFTLGDDGRLNGSSETYVAYLWSEKQGFSKFGSYTGNGNADGIFIYTGFKPAFILIKRTDAVADWVIADNKRDSFNLMNKKLFPAEADAEYTGQNIGDFVSNGIKLRDSATNNYSTNISGATYIYMAFAEAPFVNSNGVPCNAR